MNFYAKATLYDTKILHQEQRVGLMQNDFTQYISLISQQIPKEMDEYNRSVDLVCEAAHISQEVFYETYGSEPLDKQAILNEFTNQTCFSPFKTVRGFTKDRAIEMFKNVSNLALD
jgi:predicted membrane-bound dolichyl-phosphate-mannose-protein mannosyltransferase